MKLIFVLSIIAYCYADKLDRAYLPPANAASSGGSPGSLIAPGVIPDAFGQGLPISGKQPGLVDFNKPITSQNGLSENVQNNHGSATFETTFNPSGVETTRVTSNGDKYGAVAGTSTSFASNNQAPSATQQFSSNGFSASNQKLPSTSGQLTSGSFNPAFGQGAQSLNAQVYNQERPQAAADRSAEIIKYINDNNGEFYTYSYETSNGISAEESGVATNGVMAQGGYAYTGDDGKAYSVTYTADENGFQPQGEHLPTPHPIPEEILKSIEENAKAAAAGTQEGAYRPEEYESEVSPQQYNIGTGASYQSKPNQEQLPVPASTPTQINQFQATNQGVREQNRINQSGQNFQVHQQYNKETASGQELGGPSRGQTQQNNQGFIPESSQSYKTQNAAGEKSINQSPNPGTSTQNFPQLTQGQGNGYQYKQPHNAFQSTAFTQGSANQYRPQAGSQGQKAFSSGPNTSGSLFNGKQNNLTPSFGNRPSTDLNRFQQSQPQIGSGKPTGSANRPLSQSGSNRPQNGITSFENQNNQPFGFQQGTPVDQGYQYQPKQPSLGYNKPSIINNSGSSNEDISNQPAFNSNNKQNQGPQLPFYQASNPQFQNSAKQPSFGSSTSPSQNPQFFNTIQRGAPINNKVGQTPQFSQNANQQSFNYNQTPDKVSQYQQSGNLPSLGNRQPVQGSQLPSGDLGFGNNNFGQKPTLGSRPAQAPYQYNKPTQSFTTQSSNFLPLETQPSKGKLDQGNQDRSEEFGGPRQPPSFSSQDGYKY